MRRVLLFVFCVCGFHAMAQDVPSASSNLSGAWLETELPEGELSILTIVHRDDRQLPIMTAGSIELSGDLLGESFGIEFLVTAPILGQAEPAALGADIGSGESVASLFLGFELVFSIHRPAENQISLELTSCRATVDAQSDCDDIYEDFPLGQRLSYQRIF